MATIKLIRPAKYEYKQPGLDIYQSYDSVARGEIDPESVSPIAPELVKKYKNYHIISSGKKRANQTANQFSPNKFGINSDLKEIEYEMSQVISAEKFSSLDVVDATNLARKQFFQKMFSNDLTEAHIDIYRRCVKVLDAVTERTQNTLIISHGFYLKFIEVFVRCPSAIYCYKDFSKIYDGSTIGYGFLEGPQFTTDEIIKALAAHKSLLSMV